jgi:hypothetical protein
LPLSHSQKTGHVHWQGMCDAGCMHQNLQCACSELPSCRLSLAEKRQSWPPPMVKGATAWSDTQLQMLLPPVMLPPPCSRLLQQAAIQAVCGPVQLASVRRTKGGKPYSGVLAPAHLPNWNYNVSHEAGTWHAWPCSTGMQHQQCRALHSGSLQAMDVC